MAYERLGEIPLDYMPCRYGASKLLFRGPKRRPDGPYAAFLGGTETYGKFIVRPFPALVEAETGVTCINLGWPNAGVDVFLCDPDILRLASAARVVVLQLPAAQNMTNRYYSVHPRRNDRFLRTSPMMRAMFRDVDFTEFHFTRHLLRRLREDAPERFQLIRDELQSAWSARMRMLLERIGAPVVLLWMSRHEPASRADRSDVAQDPTFVTRAMVEDLRDRAHLVVEVTASLGAVAAGTRGMVFSEFEAGAARKLLGPVAHQEVAQALVPVIRDLMAQ